MPLVERYRNPEPEQQGDTILDELPPAQLDAADLEDILATYTINPILMRKVSARIDFLRASIALLHHCIIGKAPEYDQRTGELKFQWGHHLFVCEQFEVGGKSLGDFFAEHYAKDDDHAAFFAGLSAFDQKYNPSADAGDVVPGAAPAAPF